MRTMIQLRMSVYLVMSSSRKITGLPFPQIGQDIVSLPHSTGRNVPGSELHQCED